MLSVDEKKLILRKTNVFASVPDAILAQVTDVLKPVTVKAGQVIIQKGDLGTSLYVVVEGQVRAHDGDLLLDYLNKGDVFGEMSALDPDFRSASVTAEVDSLLFQLDQRSLFDLMSNQIEVVTAIIHVLCQRLRNCVQDLSLDFQYRKVLERELEIGRQIQAGFLPDKLPQAPGWEIAACLQAAREVAGDFYDVFTLPHEKRIGLVIGDVCDKGVGAAHFMTLFRSLIRAAINSENFMGWTDPASTRPYSSPLLQPGAPDEMTHLKNSVTLTNNYIASTHGQSSMFASLFFALLDPATGSLIFINGGHEAPIVFNPNGVMARLKPTGPVVGLLPGVGFEIHKAHLEPGDTLLAFTDGVTEAKNQDEEFFSEDRLVSLLGHKEFSATALLDYIKAELAKFTAGANQFDDITILAVKRDRLPTG